MGIKDLFKKKDFDPVPQVKKVEAAQEISSEKLSEERPIQEPVKKAYPVIIGEYFPWKGFMFQVTNVNDHGFTSRVCGVTKLREKEYAEYKKKMQEKSKQEETGLN